MANPKGVTRAGTPAGKDATAEAVDKQEKSTATAAPPAAASSTATDERAPSAQPVQAEGDPPNENAEAKKPSPVDALRAGMVATPAAPPETEKDETEKPGDEPSNEDETEQVDDEQQPEATDETATGDEPPAEQPKAEGDAPDESPFKGFTPAERNELGKKAQSRIKELNSAKKELARKVQETQPFIEAGRFVEGFRAEHGMADEEVIDALELAARYKAGDPKIVDVLEANLAQLRADLGMPAPVQEEQAIEPFKGALAQHYQDMVDVLGMTEEQVRLYAALDARVKAKKDAPPAQAPKPKPPAARESAPPVQPQRSNGFQPELVKAAGENVISFLETNGVPRDKARDHMDKNLWPHLAKHAPVNPATRLRDPRLIAPEQRLKAVEIAQQAFVLEQARKRAADKSKQPAPLQKSGGAPPANPKGGNKEQPTGPNPLASLRKSMVRSA